MSTNRFRTIRQVLSHPYLIGFITVLLCTAYIGWSLHVGWIPHDEGLLGQSAERVWMGDIPHRDFDEAYTGGLSYLNALSFKLFGVRSESIRWILMPFFLAYVLAVYMICCRVTLPLVAALVTAFTVCLGFANYTAALPSWYNLFFATYGTLALMWYLDTRHARWLFIAGLSGGCSFLVKITGLYFIAGGLLFLCYDEQQISKEDHDTYRSVPFALLKSAALIFFGAFSLVFLNSANPIMNVFHFLLSMTALSGYLIWNEWQEGQGTFRKRVIRLVHPVGTFIMGFLLVIGFFVAFYLLIGAWDDLWQGLFVLPAHRLRRATMPFPAWVTLLPAIVFASLFFIGLRRDPIDEKRYRTVFVIFLLIFFIGSYTRNGALGLLNGLRHQIPLITCAALALLILATYKHLPLAAKRRQELFLLVAMAAMVSLVQYPFAFLYYFFYCSTLGVLAGLYLAVSQPAAPRFLHLGLLVFWLLLMVFRVNPWTSTGYINLGPAVPKAALQLDRSHFVVPRVDAQLYNTLIPLLQKHSGKSDYIYAGPDCPEMYFLAGKKNPTRTFYAFFNDSTKQQNSIIDTIDNYQIKAIVINDFPWFSKKMNPSLAKLLASHFPYHVSIGTPPAEKEITRKQFTLRWRD